MKALVIGGTGPTGPFIVEGLLKRGYEVTILHRGIHEVEFSAPVEHLHRDSLDAEALKEMLGSRTFDVVASNYGRLRDIAQVMRGRTQRLIAIGGAAAYLGSYDPREVPKPLPMPISEDYPVNHDEKLNKWSYLVVLTEEVVREAHSAGHYNATMFRYPLIYGPRQHLHREWSIMKRLMDGRKQIIIADGGLTLEAKAYAENAGHAVLLGVDHPKESAGQIYNVSDEKLLTVRGWVETICHLMGHKDVELVEMPYELARPSRPYTSTYGRTSHRILDVAKMKRELGYRDVVPVEDAIQRTVQWIMEHRPDAKAEQELGDSFNYNAEDQIIKEFKEASRRILEVPFTRIDRREARRDTGYHRGGRLAESQP